VVNWTSTWTTLDLRGRHADLQSIAKGEGWLNFIPLWEVRTLMTDALRVVNDVDERAPPELHAGLQRIRHRLQRPRTRPGRG
jgi:hypothetical protein